MFNKPIVDDHFKDEVKVLVLTQFEATMRAPWYKRGWIPFGLGLMASAIVIITAVNWTMSLSQRINVQPNYELKQVSSINAELNQLESELANDRELAVAIEFGQL